MFEQLQRRGILYQNEGSHEIEQRFGQEFTYFNANGNPAISGAVLRRFADSQGAT
jgi:hypothetical protein